MSDDLLIDALQRHFDLSKDLDISVAHGGFLTENKFILDRESGRKYFLKQHRDEVAKRINYLETVEGFFLQGGIPVIMPVKTLEGKSHFTISFGFAGRKTG